MRSLLRAQLRLALARPGRARPSLVGGLPLLFTLAARRCADVDVARDAAAVAAARRRSSTRCCSLLGWLYVRQAERNERDFADVVERP